MGGAIEAMGLVKSYAVYKRKRDKVLEAFSFTGKKRHEDFEALKGVDLSVGRGECVGVIGLNGSGKSTLLKILAGVVRPSAGTAHVEGRVAAMLELGAGFNPEYTGIENIYLTGLLMGMGRAEVDAKLDEIVRFADIGDFIGRPVKTYSSGMFVRLAFAASVAAEPDVLLIDEALSVGDAVFQQKCYRKIREMAENATVLIVSHDLNALTKFCRRIVVMDAGRIAFDGPADAAVTEYLRIRQGKGEAAGLTDVAGAAASGRAAGSKCKAGNAAEDPSGEANGENEAARGSNAGYAGGIEGGAKDEQRASAGLTDGAGAAGVGEASEAGGISRGFDKNGLDRAFFEGAGTQPRDDAEGYESLLMADLRRPEAGQLSGRMEAVVTGFSWSVGGAVFSEECEAGARVRVRLRVECAREMESAIVGYQIRDKYGMEVFGENTMTSGPGAVRLEAGSNDVCFAFTWPEVREGDYFMTLGVGEGREVLGQTEQCWANAAAHFVNTTHGKLIYGIFNNAMEGFITDAADACGRERKEG